MASTKQLLNKFIELMHDIEEIEFKDNDRTMIYCGKEYTKTDFKNMERAVQQVQKVYQIGVNKSSKYLKANGEYNRVLRKISYYRGKKNKTYKDFEKLEELQKDLERVIYERDKAKLEHNKQDVIKQEIAVEKRKYMEESREIDDEIK